MKSKDQGGRSGKWRMVYVTEDCRGNVQSFKPRGAQYRVYTAWYDGRCLGESHILKKTKRLLTEAAS